MLVPEGVPCGSYPILASRCLKGDTVGLLMKWYNYDRPHMSLDWDNRETPARTFEKARPWLTGRRGRSTMSSNSANCFLNPTIFGSAAIFNTLVLIP